MTRAIQTTRATGRSIHRLLSARASAQQNAPDGGVLIIVSEHFNALQTVAAALAQYLKIKRPVRIRQQHFQHGAGGHILQQLPRLNHWARTQPSTRIQTLIDNQCWAGFWHHVTMLTALLRFVVDLCLLRATPAEAPSQPLATGLAMLLYLALASIGHAQQDNPLPAVLPAAQGLLLIVIGIYLLLQLLGRSGRLQQTLFSLLASACLLGMLGLALEAMLPDDVQQANPLLVTAWLLLFGWSFVVDAHIFRHAIERSFSMGMLIAVLLFALHQMLLAAWYLPAAAATAS